MRLRSEICFYQRRTLPHDKNPDFMSGRQSLPLLTLMLLASLGTSLTDHLGQACDCPVPRLGGLQGFPLGEADDMQERTKHGLANPPDDAAHRSLREAVPVARHVVQCTSCKESVDEWEEEENGEGQVYQDWCHRCHSIIQDIN